MPVGKEIFLNVTDFNFLKPDSTAADDATSSPYPNIGIITPDHNGRSFKVLIIIGTNEGQKKRLIPFPSSIKDLLSQ